MEHRDSNRPPKELHHKLPLFCAVCGDTASGYHYGVPACEGCKAFFKRSLQATDVSYRCPGNSNCKIDKMSRKCCQSCRLKKCNEVGMSKDYLGNKKIKKPHKKGKSKKSKYSEDDDFINDEPTSTQEVELQNLIKTLVALHDKSKQGIYQDAGQDSNYTCTTVSICEAIGKQLMGAIEWAKGIPGYETLTLNDQAILLQSGWIEMLLLNWIYYSLQHNNKLQFAEGLVVDSDSSKLLGLEPVFCQLISLISRVQVYGLDEEEFVCIKGIGLLNADSCGITGPSSVQELVNKFSMALSYHVSTFHPDKPQKFAKVILILPQLKYVVNHVVEYLYRVKLSGDAQLPDLLVEMLEAKSRL